MTYGSSGSVYVEGRRRGNACRGGRGEKTISSCLPSCLPPDEATHCKAEFGLGGPRRVTIPKGKARAQERNRGGDAGSYSVVSDGISGANGKPGTKDTRRRVGAYDTRSIANW